MSKVLKKEEIKVPVLPKKTVEVPELGGSVVVIGLTLGARLRIFSASGGASVPLMLSETVTDAEGQPIFTVEEWEVFGAKHFNACIELWKHAKRLSGLDAEVAEKNS